MVGQLWKVIAVLSIASSGRAWGAPKSGMCATDGEAAIAVSGLRLGDDLNQIIEVAGRTYAAQGSSLGVGSAHDAYFLAPVTAGEPVKLDVLPAGNDEFGPFSPTSWAGNGEYAFAVAVGKTGSSLVVGKWKLPDTAPTVWEVPTGKLNRRAYGPYVAATSTTVAIAWVEQTDGTSSRAMGSVIELASGKQSQVVMLGPVSESASVRILSTGDAFLVVTADSGYPRDKDNFLQQLSTAGSLVGERKKLGWEKTGVEVMRCGTSLWNISNVGEDLVLRGNSISSLKPTARTSNRFPQLLGYATAACVRDVPVVAWTERDKKTSAVSVRFAPVRGKAVKAIVAMTSSTEVIGRSMIASSTDGAYLLWNVRRRSPGSTHSDLFDLYAQRFVCSK